MNTIKRNIVEGTDLSRLNMSDLVKSIYEKQKNIIILKRLMSYNTLNSMDSEVQKREIKELESQIFLCQTELRTRYSKF